jgi:hypothetical protein
MAIIFGTIINRYTECIQLITFAVTVSRKGLKMNVRNKKLQHAVRVDSSERVETGGLQFEDDFPGYFIRGDDCANIVHSYWKVKDSIARLPEEYAKEMGTFYEQCFKYHVMKMLEETIGEYQKHKNKVKPR